MLSLTFDARGDRVIRAEGINQGSASTHLGGGKNETLSGTREASGLILRRGDVQCIPGASLRGPDEATPYIERERGTQKIGNHEAADQHPLDEETVGSFEAVVRHQ